jgi:hypothetical protein
LVHLVAKRLLRIILGLAGLAFLLLLALAVALYLRPDLTRPGLENLAASAGIQLKIKELDLKLSPLRIELKGVELKTPDGAEMVNLQELSVQPYLRWPKGGMPSFRRIEVKGLEAILKAAPGEGEAGSAPQPLGGVFLVDEMLVNGWSFSYSRPGMGLSLKGEEFSLSRQDEQNRLLRIKARLGLTLPDQAAAVEGGLTIQANMSKGPVMQGILNLGNASFSAPGLSSPLEVMLRFKLTPQAFWLDPLRVNLAKLTMRADSKAQPVGSAFHLEASARGGLSGDNLTIRVKRLEAPGIFEAKGEMSYQPKSAWRGQISGRLPDLAGLKKRFEQFIPPGLKQIKPDGSLPFFLRMQNGGHSSRLALEFNTDDIKLAWPLYRLDAALSGPVKLNLSTSGIPSFSGDVSLTGRMAYENLELKSFKLRLPLNLDLNRPWRQGFELSLPPGAIRLGKKALGLKRIDVNGAAAMAAGGALRLELNQLTAAGLGRFTGSWEMEDGRLDGWLKSDKLPAAKAATLAGPWLGEDISAWSPEGSIDLAFKFYDLLEKPRLSLRIGSQGLGCVSPDGVSVFARNLGPVFNLSLGLGQKPRIRASLQVKGGEALLDTYIFSFDQNPLNISFRGDLAGPGRYQNIKFDTRIKGLGEFRYQGGLTHKKLGYALSGRVGFTSSQLDQLFKTFVADPWAVTNPGLAGLTASGGVAFQGGIKGLLHEPDIKGLLELKSVSLGGAEAMPSLKELNLTLPLDISIAQKRRAISRAKVKKWGRIKLAGLDLGGFSIGPISNPIVLTGNRLYLGERLSIPLLGGEVSLAGIQLDRLFTPEFKGKLSIDIKALDLSRLDLGDGRIKGSLSGSMKKVRIDQKGVLAKGGISGQVMGGKVWIKDPLMLHPASSDRIFGASLKFERLDLEPLSKLLDIGRITGRISGHIKDLRIAFGQPQSFALKLESVEDPRSDQSVSLKAVNTISVLGTGSGLTGIGVGFFASFFSEFPYSKIGMSCKLQNDVFQIKGLIKDAGVEYLVKRPFWGGINVINRNQDNRITFSDMLDRLKRIQQSDAAKEGQ